MIAGAEKVQLENVQAMEAFGRELAAVVQPGDIILLGGDLGAGKTTLARALIRALAPEHGAFEVPSPTFTLVQSYDFTRVAVVHADLYRVSSIDEAIELGLDDPGGVLIVEWPERAEGLFRGSVLEINLAETPDGEARVAQLTPHGRWRGLVERMSVIRSFLSRSGWSDAERRFLQGDASSRRYERLFRPDSEGRARPAAILMDMPSKPDGPVVRDGLPYSRLAHLAEGVRPFIAVGEHLRSLGLSAPAIYASDVDAGLLLLEDLGTNVYGGMVLAGADMDQPVAAAVEVLLQLTASATPRDLPLPGGSAHSLPEYDRRAREIEVELLLDWYWPSQRDESVSEGVRQSYLAAWRELWPLVETDADTIVLRDYHSPNLLWMPDRSGVKRVGIIDYQDAVLGHAAYDLVSLLQDARVDLAQGLEQEMLARYLKGRAAAGGFDRTGFQAAYAVYGAQRAAKILGIFTRLSKRDGKHGYLRHIPRMRRALAQNLRHEKLTGLRQWFERELPEAIAE